MEEEGDPKREHNGYLHVFRFRSERMKQIWTYEYCNYNAQDALQKFSREIQPCAKTFSNGGGLHPDTQPTAAQNSTADNKS